MIDACGGVRKIHYSEAASIAALIPELLENEEEPTISDWTALELTTDETEGQGLRRTAVQDAISVDGTVLLLVKSNVLGLRTLGALIWDLTDSWTTRDDLLHRVIQEIGDHPSATELLHEAIEELLISGVLESV
ncbi:hypothetical protein [Arthrobacter psychrolactophilus]